KIYAVQVLKKLFLEYIWGQEIHDPYPVPCNLVCICRSYTPTSCADLFTSLFYLVFLFYCDMIGHYQMSILRYIEIIINLDFPGFETIYFFDECSRIDYNAIADDTLLPFVEYARGYKVKDIFFIVYYNCVSRIVSTLITGYQIGLFSKKINDLTFSLITPLGTNNNNRRHSGLPLNQKY